MFQVKFKPHFKNLLNTEIIINLTNEKLFFLGTHRIHCSQTECEHSTNSQTVFLSISFFGLSYSRSLITLRRLFWLCLAWFKAELAQFKSFHWHRLSQSSVIYSSISNWAYLLDWLWFSMYWYAFEIKYVCLFLFACI